MFHDRYSYSEKLRPAKVVSSEMTAVLKTISLLGAMLLMSVVSEGKELTPLCDAVLAAYKTARSDGGLSPQIAGTNITTIVEQFVKPGMPFDEAEKLLRDAGFVVRPRPDLSTASNPNRARDWYAVLASLELPPATPLERSVAYVSLLPFRPGQYGSIQSIEATISISHL